MNKVFLFVLSLLFVVISYAGECNINISFEYAKKPLYTLLSLKKPNRFVIDFSNVDNFEMNRSYTNNSCIKDIRTNKTDNGNMRMVFELSRPAVYTTTMKEHKGTYYLTFKVHSKNMHVQAKKETVNFRLKSEKKDFVVVIDPGHGGYDPGAIGVNKVKKNITLALAKELKEKINAKPGFKAYLTRSKDQYLSLRKRLIIANKYTPDIFIAIHADSNRSKYAKGVSIYTLSEKGASSEAARVLAEKENTHDYMGDLDLSPDYMLNSVLIDLMQVSTVYQSTTLGKKILYHVSKVAPLHRKNVEQAGFVVLKSPNIPSVLIETGFVSNPVEGKKLAFRNYRHTLVLAMRDAIIDYANFSKVKQHDVSSLHTKKRIVKKIQIKKGDNFFNLAKKYHTSVAAIKKFNKIKSNKISIGQFISIPLNR